MFYFYADKKGKLDRTGNKVLLKSSRLFANLRSAVAKSHKRILVIETDALKHTEEGPRSLDESVRSATDGDAPKVMKVPLEAIRNISPYRPPDEILAGGGLVTRVKKGKLQVLVIFRRGVWDLPKGKLDKGETIEECAVREVNEETGIRKTTILTPLCFTVHGYDQNKRFKVKTTHWFLMSTAKPTLKPQKSEDIEEVRWMSWGKAQKRIGYPMLRSLLERTRPLVEDVGM